MVPEPQLQTPLMHDGLSTGHEPQVAPPIPHAVALCEDVGTQVLPWQQPEGQVLPLHTHAPEEQVCPVTHAVPPPQVQLPLLPQPSAKVPAALQLAQTEPVAAHCVADVAVHVPSIEVQHPVVQLTASQMQLPVEQRWPAPEHAAVEPQRHMPPMQASARFPQSTQLPPPVPQVAIDGVRHMLEESQQPFGQVVESHTQVPFEQRCPAAQAGPVPQVHEPAVQRSVAVVAHETHAAPGTPQVVVVSAVHTLPAQQPVGQMA